VIAATIHLGEKRAFRTHAFCCPQRLFQDDHSAPNRRFYPKGWVGRSGLTIEDCAFERSTLSP
jgi:hypothetical protein